MNPNKLSLDGVTYQFDRLSIKAKKKTTTDNERFDRSIAWRVVRSMVIALYGKKCLKCGTGQHIQVDHIKPKSLYPWLALNFDNLQPLCWSCNKTKGSSVNDYR